MTQVTEKKKSAVTCTRKKKLAMGPYPLGKEKGPVQCWFLVGSEKIRAFIPNSTINIFNDQRLVGFRASGDNSSRARLMTYRNSYWTATSAVMIGEGTYILCIHIPISVQNGTVHRMENTKNIKIKGTNSLIALHCATRCYDTIPQHTIQ